MAPEVEMIYWCCSIKSCQVLAEKVLCELSQLYSVPFPAHNQHMIRKLARVYYIMSCSCLADSPVFGVVLQAQFIG